MPSTISQQTDKQLEVIQEVVLSQISKLNELVPNGEKRTKGVVKIRYSYSYIAIASYNFLQKKDSRKKRLSSPFILL